MTQRLSWPHKEITGYRLPTPVLDIHVTIGMAGRQQPKAGDHIVGERGDRVVANGGHLRERFGDQRPHDDEDE